jgi:hypothetical protein
MVEQVTFQTVFQFLQTVGILVGVYYYIATIRNTEKTQRLQLETRQAQLLSSFTSMAITNDSFWKDMMYWFDQPKMEWEEFIEKHPRNSDSFSSLMRLFSYYEMIGLLARKEFVDVKLVHELASFQWDKFKPIVKGIQEAWGSPNWMSHYEWLGEAWKTILGEEDFLRIPE